MNNSTTPPSTSVKGQIVALVLWILGCFAASAVGVFFMPGEWYAGLTKPSWNPPNWIFGPVWTALYLMMAIAAWLVWKQGGFAKQRPALSLFLVQLILNMAWSPLFFGMHSPLLAFVDIVLLWAMIVITIVVFWKVSKPAAWLLIPYGIWVSFAAALNFTIWRLNA